MKPPALEITQTETGRFEISLNGQPVPVQYLCLNMKVNAVTTVTMTIICEPSVKIDNS